VISRRASVWFRQYGLAAGLLIALTGIAVSVALAAQSAQPAQPAPAAQGGPAPADPFVLPPYTRDELINEIRAVVVRLPLSAALGTALALRPRRRGTPARQPAVVQTQIVLAVVGALIMLVVGASLARAFGIVGAANLIRYRSKIDDPKDAVVMLSALSVGLAAGVGLFVLALFSTMFLVAALWIIEGFEPQTRVFELCVKLGDHTADLKPKIEAILRRFKTEYELRSAGEDEVSYLVTAPLSMHTDRVSNALIALAEPGKGEVKWGEKPKAKGK
jgi:uncharacterized membrane protein YhiD involved in acid resistance